MMTAVRKRLENYALGHGGLVDAQDRRFRLEFHVSEISGAWRFAVRELEKARLKAKIVPVLGNEMPVDNVILAATAWMELEQYAAENGGRFHVIPRFDVKTTMEFYADFEVGEAKALNWLTETIWMFGLQATAVTWSCLNEEARQRLDDEGEVIGK
ncbi:hypothetical protein [Mesorhizobium sp. A623]